MNPQFPFEAPVHFGTSVPTRAQATTSVTPRIALSFWLRSASILAVLVLLALPSSAQGDTYRVLLKNGNTFSSPLRPQVASFDDSMIVFRSEGGHLIALPADDIETVESDIEFQGYGTMINRTTIMVGFVANDAIDPSEGNFDAAVDAGNFQPNLSDVLINQPFLGGTTPVQVPSGDSPFSSSSATALEAPVYDLPPVQ